ncbi:hypothetical protein J5N97_022542 [Dioscorea zingiberensis]|uniref:Uncharacterized protein n=1 Tax=Dioscorea zingiberensis TaxID=325984 RepID=A0A9D5CBE5_9LILI|nr:hypothetical protein J5N97_022542 [Dioscorea zingiberensis]
MVLKKSSVCPSSGCVPEATFPLTFFDVLWIHAHPVERIFFYPLPQHYCTTDFMNSIVPSLTSSLSLTLHHFYPLAGKLRHSDLNSSTDFEIHYKHGDSVSLTVAESHADFQLLSSNHAQPFNDVYTLVPVPDKFSDDSKPLLSLQVTFFPNSGISIAIALHHAACDGLNFMHFFKSWALAYRSEGSVPLFHPPPMFDRSLVNDPHGCHSIFLQDLLSFPAEEAPGSSKLAVWDDAVCATFLLSLEHIQSLKKIFSTKSRENKTPSSFAVACAYAWVCYVKTRDYSIKERAYFLFAVDCRGKLKPPVPAAFFGNCIGPGFIEEDVERLIGEDGFVVACKAIGRTIEACKDDILKDVQEWTKKINTFVGTGKSLTTAGSPNFRVYDVDFGWGRPSKVQVTSIQKTGAICLAEGKQGQGIEIGFVRTKAIIDEFSSVFYNGLELLHSA